MTFRWAWNQRTAWREKACGRSWPANTRSSRDSRTGWEWKSSAGFPGGWSRQRPRCCSVPGTAANSARRAPNRIAAASWTCCTRNLGLGGVHTREVRAYRRSQAGGTDWARYGQMTRTRLTRIYPWKRFVRLGESADWLRIAAKYWCHGDFASYRSDLRAPNPGREPGPSSGGGLRLPSSETVATTTHATSPRCT